MGYRCKDKGKLGMFGPQVVDRILRMTLQAEVGFLLLAAALAIVLAVFSTFHCFLQEVVEGLLSSWRRVSDRPSQILISKTTASKSTEVIAIFFDFCLLQDWCP